MIFSIDNILSPEEISEIKQVLERAEFVDGKLTAGWHAKLVKNNQQLKSGTSQKELKAKICAVLFKNALFQTTVRPKTIHSILFSRYDQGMSYDTHVDNALMKNNGSFCRSDVSFTLFLNSPQDYEGGDLTIEGVQEEQHYKLDAGSAIIYPSTTLHRVNPVTQGTRLVVVGWVQSVIRDASDREILFDLETARRAIFAKSGKTPEFDLISKSIANLLRKWADI
ncbi:Fe2+-dependent dioxygenase [Waterburya agarophytonicola K14]|uniref:Fe2+-dependent dioxygenase n=1 Tax=Waterburya agarophytonicola KI4 TaxID=2874699 RepID=A0A964BUL8_9CYAN|nr:Fe2+-dependent dioxygenase [Waterburya agarophytonicola]MCC0178808.1 Fe2+-dependent dioxygenase [Waterburya agarophytonicola KI4]